MCGSLERRGGGGGVLDLLYLIQAVRLFYAFHVASRRHRGCVVVCQKSLNEAQDERILYEFLYFAKCCGAIQAMS